MTPRILVSGSRGFLGRHLVPCLRHRYGGGSIITADHDDYDLTVQSDVNRMLTVAKPDIFIHLAAYVGGIGANQENPGKFMYENLIMGTNLIHEAMERRVSKFILLGTVCAYPKYSPVPFKEEDLWNGYPEETNAPYGIAKKSLMKLVEVYHEQYLSLIHI